jgi:hypothetical protein
MWWLAGMACALAFGGVARAAQAVARYGARPRPRPMPAPQVNPKTVNAEQKKQAAKLVDEYMAGKAGGQPSAAEKKEIAKLIKDFGSDQFAVRESASKAIVKYGGKALKQLKAALKDKDAEVAQRAETAVQEITKGSSSRTVGELRRIYSAALVVIADRRKKWQAKAYAADLQAIALDNQKKTEAAAEKRTEKAEANKRVQELNKLHSLVRYGQLIKRGPGMPVAAYGCRVPLK